MDVAWSGDQFQFDEQLLSGTNEGKLYGLDSLGFGSPSSPSSPSSDELVDIPLALPILDSNDLMNPSTLTPSDSFLFSSIFNSETTAEVPPSFQVPPTVPSSVGKRHHDQLFEQTSAPTKRSQMGKKLKLDGSTKRERNKMSAAKYRQRRKVYIDGLEDHVRQLNEKLETQSKTITTLKTENQMLKEQNNYLKKLVESLSIAKASMQSISPFNLSKPENTFAKPMGAGLFLLAICCLVFSFSFQPDNGPMSSLPVRGASRTLLHHEGTLVYEEEHNNDSTHIVLPVGSTSPQYSIDVGVETVVNVELSMEPELQVIENIAARHGLGTGASAA